MKEYPEHLAEIRQGMAALGGEIPGTMAAFMGLHKAAASDGALSAKLAQRVRNWWRRSAWPF